MGLTGSTYVYFARSPLRPGLVKIGRTRYPRQRMLALEAEAILLFAVPEYVEGPNRVIEKGEVAVERLFHELYAHLRVRSQHRSRRYDREWFRADQELAHLA